MIDQGKHPQHIVFVPGFMCDERLFTPQIRALNSINQSNKVEIMRNESTFREMAMTILASAPSTFGIVGLSMGGIIALEVMKIAPERVSHLVLLNTTPHQDKSLQSRKIQIRRVRDGELRTILKDELKPRYLSPSTSKTKLIPLIAEMGEKLGTDVFVRQSVALMIRKSKLSQLHRILCPTQILTGADDQICSPDIHSQMASLIPNSRLDILPNCGHLSTLEAPNIVNKLLFKHWGFNQSNLIQFPVTRISATESI